MTFKQTANSTSTATKRETTTLTRRGLLLTALLASAGAEHALTDDLAGATPTSNYGEGVYGTGVFGR